MSSFHLKKEEKKNITNQKNEQKNKTKLEGKAKFKQNKNTQRRIQSIILTI